MRQELVIALDFETALLDGSPSVEYYRKDFRAISAAMAWRDETGNMVTKCLTGEEQIHEALREAQARGERLVVHNFQFEYGVLLYRFPGFESMVAYDTMRLAQVADNGGKWMADNPSIRTEEMALDVADSTYRTGLALVASASRLLSSEWHEHKEPYYAWLRENIGAKKGKEGQHLTSLPAAMMAGYNAADAKVTLALYETLVERFAEMGYDWRLDHRLYVSTAKKVAKAKGVGIAVDVLALKVYEQAVVKEVEEIERQFRLEFVEPIASIEAATLGFYIRGCKTPNGTRKREARAQTEPGLYKFNVGSTKQLEQLFVQTLKIVPKFLTKAPKLKPGQTRSKPFVPVPSFKAAHLSTYGKGGEILIQRRKRLLVLQQIKALLKLAEYDGRWHFDIRAAGTATGRQAGGSLV